MVRNTYRSSAGRSNIARRVLTTSGSNNGILPQVNVTALLPNGSTSLIRNAMFFGGSKKGGLAPNSTGHFVPSNSLLSNRSFSTSGRQNFLFTMKTQIGLGPRGLPGGGRVV